MDRLIEDRKIEYAGLGGLSPLRRLAEATGNDLGYVVRLANAGELRKLLPAFGQPPLRIHTPPSDAVDTGLVRALAHRASPRQAQLHLRAKRFGPA
jgi:hypothetical protein